MTTTVDRRKFLAGGASLVIGVALAGPARAQSGAAAVLSDGEIAEGVFAPNAFVKIGPDGLVTLISKHIEFGQGPYTGLATLVAEELDASWDQMRAEGAPANNELYANLFFGGFQLTGGSTSIANSFMQMRKAGAAARAMLVAAAAEEWGVPTSEITVADGVVGHAGSGRTSGFGELADAASRQTPPEDPPVKDPSDFKLIGQSLPKLDTAAKLVGAAEYTLDVYREGMKTAVIARPAIMGATVAGFSDAAARAVPGVLAVHQVPAGVAVVAESTYAALKGRAALEIEWDLSNAETRSSEEIFEVFSAAADGSGAVVEEHGDIDAALTGAETTHEVEFRFPFLAHAPLEPLDAVLEVKDGKAEVWMGAQAPGLDAYAVSQVLGLPPQDVRLNVLFAGGSFGRRAQTVPQIGLEIASIAAAEGGEGCWKLVWTREDDLTGGYYRPITVHKLRGGLDADGEIVGWKNSIVNQSIVLGTPLGEFFEGDIDPTSFEGATEMPYDLPALRVDWSRQELPVTVLWWRSVGHTHTAYATEVFLDELLEKGGKDPVEGRLALLKPEATRDRGVLEKVAEMAGWDGRRVKDGRGYGVALHESFNSYVAMIVEVSDENGAPRTHKAWVAVDCGVCVNPNVVTAQMEGGLGFGLGTFLHSELTLGPGGVVRERNFDQYGILRINEMPEVEVAIIASAEAPTGVGEPGTPPIAPAVANAWRALTGETIRRLPVNRLGGV